MLLVERSGFGLNELLGVTVTARNLPLKVKHLLTKPKNRALTKQENSERKSEHEPALGTESRVTGNCGAGKRSYKYADDSRQSGKHFETHEHLLVTPNA
jgi:hypothetical protein